MKITDVRTIILRQSKIEMVGDGSQDTVVIVVETDAILPVASTDDYVKLDPAIACHWGPNAFGYIYVAQNL